VNLKKSPLSSRLARFLLLGLLGALPLAADPLADLRANLGKLQADSPLKARIDLKVIQTSKEDDATRQTATDASVNAEAGPQGLRLSWPAQALAEARKAARLRAANPEAPKQDGGIAALGAEDAANLLSYAEPLSLLLDGAKLLGDKTDVRAGKPARLLVVEPRERLSASQRKMLKSREESVRLWLDPEGYPVAMERAIELNFSKFLISFAVSNRESRAFARVGGRLVVTSESTEGSGAGFGQSGQTKRQTKVTVLP
jgi:hypothetical protein